MRYFIGFFLLLSITANICADKIAIVVDRNPITVSDLETRVRLIKSLVDIGYNFDLKEDVLKLARASLVNEKMLQNQLGSTVSEKIKLEDMSSFVEKEEKRYNLRPEAIKKRLGDKLYKDYLHYLRWSVIIQSNSVQEIASNIKIQNKDISEFLLSRNLKDFSLHVCKLESKNYEHLRSAKDKLSNLKEVKKVRSSRRLQIEEKTTKLSLCSKQDANILRNLKEGDVGPITYDGSQYGMWFLASLKPLNITKEELQYLGSVLMNQRLQSEYKQMNRVIKKRAFILEAI